MVGFYFSDDLLFVFRVAALDLGLGFVFWYRCIPVYGLLLALLVLHFVCRLAVC